MTVLNLTIRRGVGDPCGGVVQAGVALGGGDSRGRDGPLAGGGGKPGDFARPPRLAGCRRATGRLSALRHLHPAAPRPDIA